jgi:predicted transcriptional regulator
MDELRIEIWDFLYRAAEPKSIDEIAERIDRDGMTIREAVDHEWFQINDSMVTISRGTPKP